MCTTHLVCYDIYGGKRLHLDKGEKIVLSGKLEEVINTAEDQMLYVSLGPTQGEAAWGITALGHPYTRMASPCYVL